MDTLTKIKLAWRSSYKLNQLRNAIYRYLRPAGNTQAIFIFGCQRSGTTIIQKLIALDTGVKFIGEGDEPYFHSQDSVSHHRLEDDKQVSELLRKEHHKKIVIKPLYESQHASEVLDQHINSKAIWVFRGYTDVIDSHIHYYKQDAREYIRPFFTSGNNHWLNEVIPEQAKQLLSQFENKQMTDADAYGLFWFIRNSLYLRVKDNPNILLVNYEKLVNNTGPELDRIYRFLELRHKPYYRSMIRSNAVSKPVDFQLDQRIDENCRSLYQQLLGLC